MKPLKIALAWTVLGGWAATAGTLEIKPLGKPVRLHDARIAAALPSPQIAPFERIWDLREGPTIDVATGQIVESSARSRGNAVIYDNTVIDSGYYIHLAATTQLGDAVVMTNGGRLQRMQLSVFNGDATNKLLTAKIKVVFYDGATPTPNLIASFTTPTIHFDLILPGGMPAGSGRLLTLDVTGLDPPIILPQLVYVGYILKDITGIPAAPTSIGQRIYSPPVIGWSNDYIWDYSLDGAGILTLSTFGGNPRANLYYELEVDPVAHTPPPIYDNTTYPVSGGPDMPPEAILADDLYSIPSPPGEFLDRIDFSIHNPDTTAMLHSLDVDIVLRGWNPASSQYYGESDPVHSVTFAFTNVPANVPPGYTGFFYVDRLAPLGVALEQAVLAGARFRNFNPSTVHSLGQAFYYPPTVGASDDIVWIAGWPGHPDDWYPLGGLYWRMGTTRPCGVSGDMNCDGSVDNQDIDGFINALFGLTTEYDVYLHAFPVYHPCSLLCADFSGDGFVNSQDIDGFIAELFR